MRDDDTGSLTYLTYSSCWRSSPASSPARSVRCITSGRPGHSRGVFPGGHQLRFWFGDDNFLLLHRPGAYWVGNEQLQLAAARWVERRGGHLAVLPYDDARGQADPKVAAAE